MNFHFTKIKYFPCKWNTLKEVCVGIWIIVNKKKETTNQIIWTIAWIPRSWGLGEKEITKIGGFNDMQVLVIIAVVVV